jgi:Mg-chelatase subunit ChlD
MKLHPLIIGSLSGLALFALSCGNNQIVTDTRPADAGALPPASGDTSLPRLDREAGAAAPPAADAATCAAETIKAQRLPLDVYLLMDASSSMILSVGLPARSKWQKARDAVVAFVSDPRSAGLEVGLGMFPMVPDFSCQTESDCARFFAGEVIPRGVCAPGINSGACVDASGMIGNTLPVCTPWITASGCDPGLHCAVYGKCSDGTFCTNLGQRCPRGDAANVCQPPPTVCIDPTGGACWIAPYRNPDVAIAPLPAGADAVTRALDGRRPSGGTPLDAATSGALDHLRAHLIAHPGHRGVLVVVTDGQPKYRCGGGPDLVSKVMMARAGTPAIVTSLIGLVQGTVPPPIFTELATAGGGQAFVVQPNRDLTAELLAALDQIRGASLPCHYAIPAGQGRPLDLGKVNVHFSGASASEDLVYVASADRCDPGRGGWYYDADPAKGGTPTRIEICPASCVRFGADPQGQVSLRVGCATNVIP